MYTLNQKRKQNINLLSNKDLKTEMFSLATLKKLIQNYKGDKQDLLDSIVSTLGQYFEDIR
jgi:hypothetical protein